MVRTIRVRSSKELLFSIGEKGVPIRVPGIKKWVMEGGDILEPLLTGTVESEDT